MKNLDIQTWREAGKGSGMIFMFSLGVKNERADDAGRGS